MGVILNFLKCFGRSSRILENCRNVSFTMPSTVGFSSSAIRNSISDDKDSLLKSNPYFEKYSKKLCDLQKACPEELLNRLNVDRRIDNKSASVPDKRKNRRPVLELNSLLQVENLKEKTVGEISEIWVQLHHEMQDNIAGTISSDVFNVIQERAILYPTFLFPLPRNHGYEYIVSQFCGSEVHFTPLISYQTFKENAPECLAIWHFVDLQQEKGVVLIKAEFNRDIINSTEAVCLANQLQRYYGEEDHQRLRLLQRFNDSPEEFQHMDLIVELERLAR